MKAIRSISCAILLSASAATLAAPPFDLPPLVQPASAEHHVGKVVWVDLATPDLAGSKKFYSGLFGWTFRDIHTGKTDYSVASLDGQAVGGLVHRDVPPAEPKRPAWLPFIAVRDVDAAQRTAVEHGARVISAPRTYRHRGRQAILADPEGAVFAILASGSGDPPDDLASPGEWIWSSLLARNPDAEAAFYQKVFGYEVFDVESDDELEHDILSSDNFARASVNPLPGNSARRQPHWLSFVRVADAADAAAKAVSLGGRVLVEPHTDRHGGRVAVIADPVGARLGLMEWSDDDGEKEPK